MNAASISVTKQFGFGLNVLGQSSREKSLRIRQGTTRTGSGVLSDEFELASDCCGMQEPMLNTADATQQERRFD